MTWLQLATKGSLQTRWLSLHPETSALATSVMRICLLAATGRGNIFTSSLERNSNNTRRFTEIIACFAASRRRAHPRETSQLPKSKLQTSELSLRSLLKISQLLNPAHFHLTRVIMTFSPFFSFSLVLSFLLSRFVFRILTTDTAAMMTSLRFRSESCILGTSFSLFTCSKSDRARKGRKGGG